MKVSLVTLFLVLATCYFGYSEAEYKVVCYYGSWAVYRQGNGKFDVEQIDTSLCTHYVYTFVGIGEDGSVKVLDAWNDLEDNWGKGAFKRFVNLKKQAPNAKFLIAIGGWNEGGARFSAVVANPALRAKFVQNVVAFLQKFGFDGFDLDWEYPVDGERGGHPEDYENFALLIDELRTAFNPHGYLLTAAVAAVEGKLEKFYKPEGMRKLDFINVMAYDIHGAWERTTGHNAPLYASSKDTDLRLNVAACIKAWVKHVGDPQKIVLGMGTYGRSFTLADKNNHEIGAPTYGGGEAGPDTKQRGMMGYSELCEMTKTKPMTKVWDEEQQVPYVYSGDFWLGYDDERSIALKCEFAKSLNLGGGMIWSIETDDFHGFCGTKFGLLRTINRVFGRQV